MYLILELDRKINVWWFQVKGMSFCSQAAQHPFPTPETTGRLVRVRNYGIVWADE